MADWGSLVEQALQNLGADKICVPGAKLHAEVRRLGVPDDFVAYLGARGLSFRQFLEDLKTEKALDIHLRGPADMLVGFRGAALPELGERKPLPTIREDVYEAFTRATPGHFWYLPAEDAFRYNADELDASTPVPPISLDQLIERRRRYSNQVEHAAARDSLLAALEYSANPLTGFYRAVASHRLVVSWHGFNYQTIRDEITKWASENNIDPVEHWFIQRPAKTPELVDTPQTILGELARYMEDEEIRALPIPFRAVEQMYWALVKKRKER